LMNTRGLIELVVLNIGLDIGVLSPALFAIMVIMALFTTTMTTPILRWIYLPWINSQPRHASSTEDTTQELQPSGAGNQAR
jgi:Kef-type K+ transport system membrane component KefB